MSLDDLAIDLTRRAMLAQGCRTPKELLRLVRATHPDPADQELLRKPTDQWDVYDLRHWLRLITGYHPSQTVPNYPFGTEP